MPTFAPVLKTPGALLRWAIRDMRASPRAWTTDGQYATQPCDEGGAIYVYPTKIVYLKGTTVTVSFGWFRSWRLKNAIRRLATAKICEVLP